MYLCIARYVSIVLIFLALITGGFKQSFAVKSVHPTRVLMAAGDNLSLQAALEASWITIEADSILFVTTESTTEYVNTNTSSPVKRSVVKNQ